MDFIFPEFDHFIRIRLKVFRNFGTKLLPRSLKGTRPKLIVQQKGNGNQSAKQQKDSYSFVDQKWSQEAPGGGQVISLLSV